MFNNSSAISSRYIAYDVLYSVETQKSYANRLLESAFNKHSLSIRDRALITELVYGVLRQRNWLDGIIRKYIHCSWSKVNVSVRNILRLGAYQLLKLDGISDYAAVNESVKLAPYKLAGFVNAILRQIGRSKDSAEPIFKDKSSIDYLAFKYSHPSWLIKRWIKQFGIDETITLCLADNIPPINTVRVNSLRAGLDETIASLEKDDIIAQKVPLFPDMLYIKSGQRLTHSEAYRSGLAETESLASALAVKALNPKPNEKILDIAAGRWVKTSHIAALMQNKGYILSVDNNLAKLRQLKQNLSRWDIDIVRPALMDASGNLGIQGEFFDRILVDAPCSSLGVLGRYPECRWHLDKTDIRRLAKLQKRILAQAIKYLKPSGVLVYSTCSFEPEENENVIKFLLEKNPEFKLDSLSFLPIEFRPHVVEDGCFKLLPHRWEGDGFFIARLRKN